MNANIAALMEERVEAALADDPCVVGVDFGTLSGRAVVVRASDGAELGTAVYTYPHAVIERTLPASGERLPRGVGAAGPG